MFNNEAGPLLEPNYRDYRYKTASSIFFEGGQHISFVNVSFS